MMKITVVAVLALILPGLLGCAFAQVSDSMPPAVQAGGDQTVGEGDTVTLSGSATDPEGDSLTYTWSQTGPATPRITFANAFAPSTTFTAPSVTGDTTFTLVLTADDGTQSAADTLNVTVKETGAAFITTWAVSDSDVVITLPMRGTYSILWGDGSQDENVSGSRSHWYDAAGDYTVTVLGDGLDSIRLFGDAANARQLRSIEQWGGTKWTDMNDAFYGASNMAYRATDVPDLSGVTDMTYMFFNATSFDGDLSGWDVSSVTDMAFMFEDATSFDGDLSGWNVSSVTDMSGMFEDASSFNRPLSGWNVSSVINMIYMFDGASSFNQNLGTWYIVPADTEFDAGGDSLDVTTISAQNWYLRGQSPTYSMGSGGDSDLFEMTGSTLAFRSAQDAGSYTANVRASGSGIFENGNNWRVLEIAVHGSINSPPTVQAGDDQTAGEGNVVTLSGSATDPNDDSITYTWSQTGPAAPLITFANASAPSTTFTAPSVTGDTTFTITLTADDGTQSAADTLNVTVKETGTAFITTWTTSNSDRSITLPVGGTYSILWGDGSHSPDVSGSQSHTYGAAGNYTVTVLGDGLDNIRLFGDTANARQLRSIEQWGDTKWTDMNDAFYGARNMVYRATDTPDLSGVTSMESMFIGASSFDGDLSGWDVSSVTDMTYMFSSTHAFNGDLSGWDVSSVADMTNMFSSAYSFDGDLSGWDVSSVADMTSMFFYAYSFDSDLSGWDVSSVADMGSMFLYASSFDSDLSGWDVSSVTDMSRMFFYASSFDGDLSGWDVSSVTHMTNMFDGADSFDQNLGDWYVVLNNTSIRVSDASKGVGTISAQNQVLDDQIPTYGLDTGGDSDLFVITGDVLRLNPTVDYSDKTGYSVNITSTGDFGTGNHRVYGITVTDTDTPISGTGPTVTSIKRYSPAVENTNSQALIYKVTFSEDVTGVDTADFALSSDSTGATNGNNPVISISGSGSVYYATVSAATDGTYNLDLVLLWHGIADESSNPLTNTVPTGADETYTVGTTITDTTAPTISSIERYSPSSATTDSQTLVYKVTFSEDVTGVDKSDFALSGSTGGTSSGGFMQTRSPALAIPYNQTVSDTITVADSGTATSVSVAVDITHDYIGDLKIDLIAPDGTTRTLHNHSGGGNDDIDQTYTPDFGSVSIAGTWTLRMYDNYNADDGTLNSWTLTINGGGSTTASPVTSVSGSGSVYYATVSATTDGTYNLDLIPSGHGIADESSNPLTSTVPTGADETYTVSTTITDTTAPTISSIERYSPSSATTDSQTLVYRITFSEDVTGVGTADFALSSDSTGDTNGNNPVASVSGSGDTYYATVSATTDGTYNLDLIPSGHGIADESSNPLTSTTPTGADETYTVSTTITDTTAPTISSIERYSPSSATTDSQTLVYRITFSEDVTGVGTADFALSGSAGGTSTSSGQFTQTRSPALAIPYNQTVSDTITVADSGTATSVSVAVDITHDYIGDLKIDLIAPDGTTRTLHNHSGGGNDDIDQTYTPDFGSVSIAGTWTLRMYDNYTVDDGTLNSWTLTINGGGSTTSSSVTSVSGSGDTYYATVSATTDGTYNLDLIPSGHGIADESSNPLTSTTPTGADETYTVSTTITDTTAPTISSIERYSPSSATTDSQTLVYRITFSEDVTGVGKSDFALSGSAGGTSTSSGQFTQTRSPALAIPYNQTVSDTITVADSGTATSVSVAVDITHDYIGDLKIDLIAPDGTTRTLHNHSGGGNDDIDQTYTPDFGSVSIAGTWTPADV